MTDWNHIPDDEFDAMIRKSAEGYTPPFQEEEWKRLSQQLGRKNHRWREVFSFLLLLLFVTDVALRPAGERTAAPPSQTENTAPEARSEEMLPPVAAQAGTGSAAADGGEAHKKSRQVHRPVPVVADTTQEKSTADPESTVADAMQEKSTADPWSAKNPELRVAESRSFAQEVLALQRLQPVHPIQQVPSLPPVVRPETSAKAVRERNLGLRVIYSPDLSTVGTNAILKVGSNIGLLAEYRFNRRWSLQAGVLKSIKYYSALPEQYTTSYPLKNISEIDATCTMLDIPLNLRYDFARSPLQSWFATAGATSYLMLNEKYTYHYNYGPSRKGWEGKTGFYPLGVLNFSVGYERQLFKNISLQAEPFFKIPLQKVGYGNVKLATLGLFISGKITLPAQPLRRDRRIRW